MNDYERQRIQGAQALLSKVLKDVGTARGKLAYLQSHGRDAEARKCINSLVLVAHADVREVWNLWFPWIPVDPLARFVRELALRDIAPALDRLHDAAQCRNTTPATMQRCREALKQAEVYLETAVGIDLSLPEGVAK